MKKMFCLISIQENQCVVAFREQDGSFLDIHGNKTIQKTEGKVKQDLSHL